MKFGVGRWKAFEQSRIITTKQIMACYIKLQGLLGQQSLAGFMGLHIDIDQIKKDNDAKQGVRKSGFLVNQGDKLTKQQKVDLQKINHEKYGLPQAYIDSLVIPKAGDIRVFEVAKIINAKKKLSTSEQVEMLYALQRKLEKKLKVLRKGYKIHDLKFQSYADWKYKNSRTSTQIKAAERMTSNMSEGKDDNPDSQAKTMEETALIAEPLTKTTAQ